MTLKNNSFVDVWSQTKTESNIPLIGFTMFLRWKHVSRYITPLLFFDRTAAEIFQTILVFKTNDGPFVKYFKNRTEEGHVVFIVFLFIIFEENPIQQAIFRLPIPLS